MTRWWEKTGPAYWDRAYRILGLDPLDDHIRKVVEEHVRAGRDTGDADAFRSIGASTWMCVCAARTILKKEDALIRAPSLVVGEFLIKRVKHAVLKLSDLDPDVPKVEVAEDRMKGHIRFTNRTRVYHASTDSGTSRFQGIIYHDDRWKERAVRRFHGPFAMIKAIRKQGERLLAFAEDDEPLMELTAEGTLDICLKHPEIVCQGFLGFRRDPATQSLIPLPDTPNRDKKHQKW